MLLAHTAMLARVDDTWVLERFDSRFDTSLVRFDP
jgi:hypothetical protein